MSSTEVRHESLTLILDALSRMDHEALRDRLTEAAVMEFPYATPPFPSRFDGREAVVAGMAAISKMFTRFEIRADRVYDSPATDTLTLLAASTGELKDGTSYANHYAILFMFEGNRVRLWQEYYDTSRLPRG